MAGLFFSGCTKEVFVADNEPIKLDYTVYSSEWEPFGDCYRAVLDAPDITRSVVAHGNVQVSRCYPGENYGADIWTPLPCIRTYVTVDDYGYDFYYTTFVDYEWTTGTVSIYVTTTDLYTGERPDEMYFRVFISE